MKVVCKDSQQAVIEFHTVLSQYMVPQVLHPMHVYSPAKFEI